MELLISLKGQIDKSIPESVRKAMTDIGELQKKQSSLKGIEANAQKYKELEQAAVSLGTKFNQAKAQAAQLGTEFRKNQETASQYKAQLDKARMALAGMSKSANPDAYRLVKQQISQLRDEYKIASAAAKTSGQEFKQAANGARSAGTAYLGNQTSLRRLSSELQQAGFNTQKFASSQDALQRELKETESALEQAKQVQAQYNEKQIQQAKRQKAHHNAQQDFYNATGNWQTGLSTIQTVASPLIGAIETAASFEQAMAKVKAITKSSDAELQKLTATAREMGEKTQFSASQAAEAMSYLGMAGWKSEQIIGGLPGLLDLAAASGTDLARAADIISDDLTAFGMSADQAGHMADVFAHTITSTNTNVEMLGETMKYAAPVAHLFGASLEETAALAGIMANSGIKASQAGTSLRAGFLRLAGPPKKAGKELEAMGVDLQSLYAEQREASEAMKNLGIDMEKFGDGPGKMGKILTELKEKTAGMGQEQKMAALGAVFGTQAVSGWLAVLQSSPEDFNAFVKALENSDGEAAKMAEIMRNTAQGALTRFKSAAESAAISVGSVFLPMVADAADWVAKWAAMLSQAAAEHPGLIQALGVLAAAIAAVVMTALTVNVAASGWELFGTTLTKVAESSALETIGGQVGGLLGTLKAAPGKIGKAIIGLPKTFSAAMGKIPTIIAGVGQSIMGIPAMISGAFTEIPGIVSGAFASLAAVGWPVILGILAIVAVVALVAANFDKLKETAAIVFNHISGTVAAWAAVLEAKFDAAAIKIAEVWNSITGESMKGSEVVGAIINNLGFLFGAAFDVAAGIVGTAIATIINLVVSVAQIIGGVVNVVVGLFTGDWDRAWKGAGQAVEGFAGGTLGTIKTIAGGIGSIFDTLMGKSAEVQRQAEQAQNSLAAAQMSNADAMRAMRDSGGAEAIAEAQQTAEATQQAAEAAAAASQNTQIMAQGMEATGQSAQQAAAYTEHLQNVMAQVPAEAQAAFSGMGEQSGAAAQAVKANLQQIPAQTQAAFQQLPPMAQQGTDAMVQEFSQLAAKCQPGGDAFVQAANNWGRQAYENIAKWADQMAQAVTDKLSQAWAQISAQFSAGLNVNVTTSGAGIAHNAEGGIYKKGAFLTTFAEKSPEAAIPLDGSKRAASLWNTVGGMLGLLPKDTAGARETAKQGKAQGIGKMPGLGGIFQSILPPAPNIELPPIMNMVEALPPDISTIADIIAPPTEAQMAAAPIALESPSAGGSFEINFNPQITIQGNADSGTVSQMGDMLSKLKAELIREVRREFGGMMADHQHNQRRASFAT